MAVGDREADLHHKKNRPDHPPGHEPGDFPPYVYQPYPKWIYHEQEAAKIIENEMQLANHLSRGWCENPNDAHKAFAAYERERSDNAAQVLADDRRMSDTAKEEYHAVNDAADDNVLDLPAGKLDKSKSKAKDKAKE
jgi:hypothetical protein